MKLLSIIIPCYNSQEYMKKAIDSVVGISEDIEVIIVNDGSIDNTLNIAYEYEKKYNYIKVVSQENKGHGGAVNAGLNIAEGKYVRVLDSDDSISKTALIKLINVIKSFVDNDSYSDVIITNFIYDKVDKKKKKVMRYNNVFKENEILTWNKIGKLKLGQYILMHSVTFRTSLLKERANLELPNHLFYVDNLFIFIPLHYVRSIYYININLYKYFIGRDDQSVNESVMLSRIQQQITITKMMIDAYTPNAIIDENQERVLIDYLNTIIMVTSVLLNKIGTKEALQSKKEVWNYLRSTNTYVYKKARYSIYGLACNINSKAGIKLTELGYKISKKLYGFN